MLLKWKGKLWPRRKYLQYIQMTKDLYTGKQLLKAIAKATQYKNQWLEYTLHRSCLDVQLAQEKKPNVREHKTKPEGSNAACLLSSENMEQLSPWKTACQLLIKVNICLLADSTSTDTTKKYKGLCPQYNLCKNILLVPNWELPKYPSTH